MNTQNPHHGYVKTDRGDYLLQIPDSLSRWGFTLCDEDQSFDGGFGIAREWEPVKPEEVPDDVRDRLDWILEDSKVVR